MLPLRWKYSLHEPDARVKILHPGPESLFPGSLVEIEMAVSGFRRLERKERERMGGCRIHDAAPLNYLPGNLIRRHQGLITE